MNDRRARRSEILIVNIGILTIFAGIILEIKRLW